MGNIVWCCEWENKDICYPCVEHKVPDVVERGRTNLEFLCL